MSLHVRNEGRGIRPHLTAYPRAMLSDDDDRARCRSSVVRPHWAPLFFSLTLCACEAAHPPARNCDLTRTPARSANVGPSSRSSDDPLAEIAARRASFHEGLSSAQSDAARHGVVREAAHYLEEALIDVVLPRWDGTPWAFSGTSTTPRTGSIACGYFVTTALEEAGLRVERRRLAQQASEIIVTSLVPPEAIERFSNVPVEDFTARVAKKGRGLYVVGLDNHVGFLIVRSGKVLFHHSSYVGPIAVVREEATASSPLRDSKYRVVGKLFTDDALVEAWIRGAPVPTKARAQR